MPERKSRNDAGYVKIGEKANKSGPKLVWHQDHKWLDEKKRRKKGISGCRKNGLSGLPEKTELCFPVQRSKDQEEKKDWTIRSL